MPKKLTIKDMQKVADKKGGRCLSATYVNNRTKLLWECTKGHQWQATPDHIKSGEWCPVCVGQVKGTIEGMQQIATQHGGKCLSKSYFDAMTKLRWQCEKGHQWEAIPHSIRRGSWCPVCNGNIRLTISEMHEIAKEYGGRCLSKNYINSHTKLLWQCAEGHQWEAAHSHIKNGQWCPYCAGNVRLTIADMQQIAEEREGVCLSSIYTNVATKLLWQCAEGHQWEAKPSDIKSGCWCPECSSGLGERICRAFFEQLFDKKFPRHHPKWLVNRTGNRMELDGYCKALNLAFEHHGEQHYSGGNLFIDTEEALNERQDADKYKRMLCEAQGIVLIEIPEIPSRLSLDKVKVFIKNQCNQYGFPLPQDFDAKEVNLKKAYATPNSRQALIDLQNIAKQRGGKCLSEPYIHSSSKLLWECIDGHQWEATPGSIKSGRWCHYCVGQIKGTIEDMQQIAKERGGKCLSENYHDKDTPLLWECAKGHRWRSKPGHIKGGKWKQGTWCPYCANKVRGTLEVMHAIAEERGGRCLSDVYINNKTKLLWGCAEGHRWEAIPSSIKRGSWCPDCAGNTNKHLRRYKELQKNMKDRNSDAINTIRSS
jgi:hypothetical protein